MPAPLLIPDALPLSAWGVVLDPPEVATNRTALDINSDTITIHQDGIDWGDAAIQEYLADQAVGSSPVDYRLPNRQVTMTLSIGNAGEIGYHAAKAALQQKVALIQREGGWLKRDTGVPLFADVVNATLTFPDHWGPTGFMENAVKLVLECSPDFFGDEVMLDVISGTGYVASVLQQGGTQAMIAGDHPGRCRIVVTDTSGTNQKGLIWGLSSRYYDSAGTAALAYNAADMSPINGAAVASGVSGAYGGKVVAVTAELNIWHPFLVTDLAAGQLTHRGTYQVWVRCTVAAAGTQLRLAWSLDDTTMPEYNDQVTVSIAGYETKYAVVNLGQVIIDASPVGAHWWRGVIQAFATSSGQNVAIDEVWFQPLDDAAGKSVASATPPAFAFAANANPSAASNDASVGTVAWTNPTNVFAEDPNYASASLLTLGAVSQYLTTTGYGFAIPAGATITGIIVRVAYRTSRGSSTIGLTPLMMKAGVVQGASAPGSFSLQTFAGDQIAVYGDVDDLWGLFWSAANINAAGFGFALTWSNPYLGELDLWVNKVAITVYYVSGGGFTVATDAVVNASRTAEIRTEGIFREDTGTSAYVPVGDSTGDLPRIPPSGLEGRPVELLVKPSRGDLANLADVGINAFTAQVAYRPSYLFPA